MTLVHDTFTRYPATADSTEAITGGAGTGTRTFTHAGSASACGAVLFILYGTTTGIPTSPPTYGGIPMVLRTNRADTSEAGRVLVYTLDDQASFPTGSQSVTIIHSVADARHYVVCTVTSTISARARFYQSHGVDTFTGANPSLTLRDFTVSTLVYGALVSGLAAPTDATTQASPAMSSVVLTDLGAKMNRVDRTTGMVAAAASFTFGYTAASDDYAIAVIAFEEYTYPGPAVINHDLFTRFPADLGLDATTGVRSFSHAGAVDASGAIVIVASYGGTGYTGTAQYGGVSMTLRENYYDSSKTLALRIYTLDDQVSFPTGTQTVTFDGSTTSKLVICATVKCSSGNRARFHTSAGKTSASGVTGDAVNLTTTTTTLLYGAGSIPDFSILPDFSAGRGSTAFPGPNTHWVSVDRYSDAVSAGTQAFGYLAPGTSLFGIAAVALEAFATSAPVSTPPRPVVVRQAVARAANW